MTRSGCASLFACDPIPHAGCSRWAPLTEPRLPAAAEAPPLPPQEAVSLLGQVIAERYRVLSVIGEGGMGRVYLAEHVHMRKPVAIKVLHRELTTVADMVARFEREAIAAGRINDPHVVAATDFGRLADDSLYLVLEYVEGPDLAEVMNEGPVPLARAVAITRQLVQALIAAHGAGVVHRDLKPENVMVVRLPDGQDQVKVLDFGIAKLDFGQQQDSGLPGGLLTRSGTVFGTPAYMAPEQAAGDPVDHRADLYTVGILLYEMLAGEAPFLDDDVARIVNKQMTSPPGELPPTVHPLLRELVMDLLAKDPDDRPQTAEDVLVRLDEALRALGLARPSGSAPSLPPTEEQGQRQHTECRGALTPTEVSSSAPPGPHILQPLARALVRWRTLLRGGAFSRKAALVAASALLVVIVGSQASRLRRSSSTGAPRGGESPALPSSTQLSPSAHPTAFSPQVGGLLVAAARGREDALRALERRPAAHRTSAEWVALGRGRMVVGQIGAALEAYREALREDSSLARDRVLLEHVRRAARREGTAEDALRLAAYRLGPGGADLLYDVWVATREKTPTTQLARQLVYSSDVRANASPALEVALDLREARRCEDFRQLLPRVTLHGDLRSGRILRPLLEEQGCGPGGKQDCYPCLRHDSALEDALAAAERRLGPVFGP